MPEEPVEDLTEIFEMFDTTPMEGHDEEWIGLTTKILQLSPIHIPSVQEALKQGRWRTVENQKSYLKTVAGREAVKMNLVDDPKERLPPPNSELPELADDFATTCGKPSRAFIPSDAMLFRCCFAGCGVIGNVFRRINGR